MGVIVINDLKIIIILDKGFVLVLGGSVAVIVARGMNYKMIEVL